MKHQNPFNRIAGIFLVLLAVMICFATVAIAGPIDAVKGFLGTFSVKALGLIITGLISIGVIATKRHWIAGIFVAVGNLCIGVGQIPLAIGAALADGKVDGDELKNVWDEMTDVPTLVKQVVTVFKGNKNA